MCPAVAFSAALMENKLENRARQEEKECTRGNLSLFLDLFTFLRLTGRILWRSLRIDPGIQRGYWGLQRMIYDTFCDNSVREMGGNQTTTNGSMRCCILFPRCVCGCISTGSFTLDAEASDVICGKRHSCQVLERTFQPSRCEEDEKMRGRTRRLFSSVTYSQCLADRRTGPK